MYTTFKVIHVLAAVVWVGTGFGLSYIMGRLASAKEMGAVVSLAKVAEGMTMGYFTPLATIAVLAGVGMVETGTGFGYGDPFIGIGFAGFIISMGVGHGAIKPTVKKFLAAAADGSGPEVMAPLGQRIGMVSMINSVVLFVTIWAMVAKP